MVATKDNPKVEALKAKFQKLAEASEAKFRSELAFAEETCPSHKIGRLDFEVSEREFKVIYDCSACRAEEAEAKMQTHFRHAGVPERVRNATFENFQCPTPAHRKAVDAARNFLRGGCENLIICGGYGTGKGHLASAIIRERNRQWDKWITVHGYLKLYHQAYDDNSHEVLVRMLGNRPLLILDEAYGNLPKDGEQALFELIDFRWNKHLPIIALSNLKSADLTNNWLGGRSGDRLRDGAKQIWCDWESFRSKGSELQLAHGLGI